MHSESHSSKCSRDGHYHMVLRESKIFVISWHIRFKIYKDRRNIKIKSNINIKSNANQNSRLIDRITEILSTFKKLHKEENKLPPNSQIRKTYPLVSLRSGT